MATSDKNSSEDADIQKKLDAIKARSKHSAKQMATKLKAQRDKTKS